MTIEIIFIPGTTVVGFVGFFTIITGAYLSFTELGHTIGWITSISTSGIIGGTIYYAMKKKVWRRFSLHEEIIGKVMKNSSIELSVNLKGKAISALRPSGIAEFNQERIEVASNGQLIDAGSSVKIISIHKNKIIVEAL